MSIEWQVQLRILERCTEHKLEQVVEDSEELVGEIHCTYALADDYALAVIQRIEAMAELERFRSKLDLRGINASTDEERALLEGILKDLERVMGEW